MKALHPFIRLQILIVSACIVVSSILIIGQSVIASPSLPAPDGNPSIPSPPQGPQGPQGNTGNQGPQGPQGNQGPQGPTGDNGYSVCNFPGYGAWMSYGWDGGGAFSVGISFSCISFPGVSGATYNFNVWGY